MSITKPGMAIPGMGKENIMAQTEEHFDNGDRFISGVRNITEMREDLKLGIMCLVDIYQGPINDRASEVTARKDPLGEWSLWALNGEWALCWNNHTVVSCALKLLYNEPPRSFVSQMRREFGELVDGIRGLFPEHNVQISHIFDAADAE